MQFHLVLSAAALLALSLPCITAVGYGDEVRDITDNDAKVLILGGGPAGIKAAATLIENGFNDIIILEGREESLRGVLAPIEFGGKTFAPGSLWSYTPDLVDLIEQDINYKETNGYGSFRIRNDQGEDLTAEAGPRRNDLYEAAHSLDEVAAAVNAGNRTDVSQKTALAIGGWVASTDVGKVLEWYKLEFYSGVSTRDSSTAGPVRQLEVFNRRTKYLILDEGRTTGDSLLAEAESMLEEGHVRLGKVAQSVDHTDETTVRVVTTDGTEYTGHFLVVANTVGVLQQGELTFDPPLPEWKTAEIFKAQMGTVDPIFMKFDSKFWDDEEMILHASNRTGYYPAFMNLEADGFYPEGTNILVGFLTGDEAYRAELLDDSQVQAEVIGVLKGMYGAENVPEPTEFAMSRFATNPLTRGSRATWSVGNIPEDGQLRLSAKVGRLYFALEDASSEYIGIPYGGVRSGEKAAQAIHACYMFASCPVYEPVDEMPGCKDKKPTKPTKPTKGRKDFNWGH